MEFCTLLMPWGRVLPESLSHSTGQGILHLSWNPKVHYHVHKSLPLVPVIWQMKQVHALIFYFFKIWFNIILLFMLQSLKRSLPIRFSDILYAFFMPHVTHSLLCNHPNNMELFTLYSKPHIVSICIVFLCHYLHWMITGNISHHYLLKQHSSFWIVIFYSILGTNYLPLSIFMKSES